MRIDSALPLVLGIDGGGTRCRARLSDAQGRILGEGVGGPANIRLGLAVAWAGILAATDAALAAAGLDRSALPRLNAGFGLAGIVAAGDANPLLVTDPVGFGAIAVASDAHTACLGAAGGDDGAILITGTGSQGYAIIQGRGHAIGGYGLTLSDQGSGAWIGREAVRMALLAHDGLVPASPLTTAVLAQLGAKPGRGPVAVVDWSARATPGDYGALAPLVLDLAGQGDGVAEAILRQAARDLAAMVARLCALGAPGVSLMGGLAGPLRPWLPEAAQAALVAPRGDALDGALLLARPLPA